MTTIPVTQLKNDLLSASATTYTTCPYCGVGCGVAVTTTKMGIGAQVMVTGDSHHPANFGKLCIKGSRLADTLGLETRVLHPLFGRKNQRLEGTWQQAIHQISTKFKQLIEQYGRESIAFYVSGQLLTEDYYVVNKFVKGYLGTANIDTNSRLCMSSAVAAHKRSFGEDIVPASYLDFEHTNLVVLVGSNTAWCHPVLYQRIMQAKSNRDLKVIVIDPRFTATCEQADLHLPILPGQDVILFNGLLQYLSQNQYTDIDFVQLHTENLAAALTASKYEQDINFVAKETGISIEQILQFYHLFAQTSKVMTLFSMGVNQSSQGVNKANAIINCHLITGKIGKLGSSPFSMTGQPNAMGGREVGGLSNMLAAHLELEHPEHQHLVQEFWQSPHIAKVPGLKAIDLFQAIEKKQIKAVWIMATNPVVSLPNADQVKRALEQCEFVVVSDVCTHTDTTEFADILLPALGWGEKDGTVTNSERRISRQRPFLNAPQQAKADWWALCQVAQSMGFSGFNFNDPSEIFSEHAALSAYKNTDVNQHLSSCSFRYFNLSGLTQLDKFQYDALSPIQWPVLKQKAQSVERLFTQGQYSHANGKARFIATNAVGPIYQTCSEYPLILNTGRIRDQWHTMTRTGLSANLTTHRAEPYCDVHPQDAIKYGLQHNALTEIKSRWGTCVLRVQVIEGIRRGQIFAPIHWSDQFSSDARIGKVVNPAVDAISGEPEFKHTPVSIKPFHTKWQGVLLVHDQYVSRVEEHLMECTWWNKIRVEGAFQYEISDRRDFKEFQSSLKTFLPFIDESFEWLNFHDTYMQIDHSIVIQDNKAVCALYIAPSNMLPNRDWLTGLFKRERLSAQHRKALLAGAAVGKSQDEGPLVCSCFKVGKNKIIDVIQSQNITHEKQVTACLKAGGNCGSCLPEIRGLIKACRQEMNM